jgi:hypothetical protein
MNAPEEPLTLRGEKLSDLRRRAHLEWETPEAVEAEHVQAGEENADTTTNRV